MRQGRRDGLSAAEKADIWRHWKAGESLHEIGRAFGKDHGSIQFLLLQYGGIAPAIRHCSQRTLTLCEREDISRGIASGLSIREIVRGLQRAASTVSREVVRNGGRALTVCLVGALSYLDDIAVRIADVAANLAVLGDRLRDELRSSTLP
jgi:hypothetical protein